MMHGAFLCVRVIVHADWPKLADCSPRNASPLIHGVCVLPEQIVLGRMVCTA